MYFSLSSIFFFNDFRDAFLSLILRLSTTTKWLKTTVTTLRSCYSNESYNEPFCLCFCILIPSAWLLLSPLLPGQDTGDISLPSGAPSLNSALSSSQPSYHHYIAKRFCLFGLVWFIFSTQSNSEIFCALDMESF